MTSSEPSAQVRSRRREVDGPRVGGIHAGVPRLRAQRCQSGVGSLYPVAEFRDVLRVRLPMAPLARSPVGEEGAPVGPMRRSALGQGSRVLGHVASMAGGCDAGRSSRIGEVQTRRDPALSAPPV